MDVFRETRFTLATLIVALIALSCLPDKVLHQSYRARAQSQTFTINGRVTDPPLGTGNGISGVTISLVLNSSTQLTALTDAGGNFSFAGIAPGSNYEVAPSKIDYFFGPVSQGGTNLSFDRTLFFTGSTSAPYYISGRVADGNNNSVSDVTLTLEMDSQGTMSLKTTSTGPDGNYSYGNIDGCPNRAKVTPSKAGLTFSPLNIAFVSTSCLVGNGVANFTATPIPAPTPTPPAILTEENTDRAIALNATTFVRGPFSVFTENFGADNHTRLMLFVSNLELLPGEDASVVTVQAEDSLLRSYPLPVEYVGRVANRDWLMQVNIRLPNELANAGEVRVRINLRGVMSNQARISIQ